MTPGNGKRIGSDTSSASAVTIPFRQEGTGSGGLIEGMVVCLLLLALTYVVLRIARQRGWLARWGVPVVHPIDQPHIAAPRILQQLRLSPKTMLLVVRHASMDYVIAESGVATVLLDKIPVDGSQDEA